jgi:hypothetical protein
VPVEPTAAAGLRRLVLNGPTGSSEVGSSAALRTGPTSAVEMHRVADRVELRWDPSSSPMILLRDAATREVLALGRNGTLQVPARGPGTEVHVSHGASSRRLVLP